MKNYIKRNYLLEIKIGKTFLNLNRMHLVFYMFCASFSGRFHKFKQSKIYILVVQYSFLKDHGFTESDQFITFLQNDKSNIGIDNFF